MRSYLESLEEKILATYASKSKCSLGKVYEEPLSSTRTIFQRDRDRIIHSKAFRRLKRKTQVFIISISDHYRSRLTHTLEVSQLSRHLARILRLNEDLAEAIALAHDLGHPPFGHAGERILNELMKDNGGFEHNIQSLRILDKLEHKYPNFPGLNLCFEIRAGILLKHKKKLWPALNSTIEKYNSLEAQVSNLADEIAYNNHDIDDGLSSEIINLEQLKAVKIVSKAISEIKKNYSNLDTHQLQHLIHSHIITMQIEDIYHTSLTTIKTAGIETLEDVYHTEKALIHFSKEMAELNKELRTFLHQNLYRHEHVLSMNKEGQSVISKLFSFYSNNLNKLPLWFKENINETNKYRVIVDYIAGMTDSYAINKLKEVDNGSI